MEMNMENRDIKPAIGSQSSLGYQLRTIDYNGWKMSCSSKMEFHGKSQSHIEPVVLNQSYLAYAK
jgi:hypothetical protein